MAKERKKKERREYAEISMSHADMDKAIHKYAPHLEAAQEKTFVEAEEELRFRKKRERMLKKVFKAAVQFLTETQFQIFVMRFVYKLREEEIARQIDKNQSYVALQLQLIFKKIRKKLRIKTPSIPWTKSHAIDEEDNEQE